MCFLQRQSNWCFVNMRITNRNFHLGLLQLIRFESLWWLMLSFYQLNHFQISNVNLTKLCLATPWTKTNEWINYVSWYEEKVSDELRYSKIPTKDRWILRHDHPDSFDMTSSSVCLPSTLYGRQWRVYTGTGSLQLVSKWGKGIHCVLYDYLVL